MHEMYFPAVDSEAAARGQMFNYYLYSEQSAINAFTLTELDIVITVSSWNAHSDV